MTNMSMKSFAIIVVLLLTASFSAEAAEKVDPAAQKMREMVRNTMIQLRDANAKLAAAQSAQAEAEDKVKELQGQLEELTKKSASERKTANETIDDLSTKLANSESMGNHLAESLTKWKQGYAKLADYAKATEGKRAEYASKCILLERRIAEQQVRNAEMYRLANEVLDRYAQFGLGTAISAREPFVGITKVKFQNLVQDYQNKLTDQTIRKESESPQSSSEPPASAKKVE
jgi:chromosome segregation ATPase